jgi:hypothetical protein
MSTGLLYPGPLNSEAGGDPGDHCLGTLSPGERKDTPGAVLGLAGSLGSSHQGGRGHGPRGLVGQPKFSLMAVQGLWVGALLKEGYSRGDQTVVTAKVDSSWICPHFLFL